MEYSPPPFFKRGPNLLTRLTLFSLLSLVLLFADARFRYMDDVRSVVGVILYPLQELVDTPTRMGRGILGYFSLQTTLRSETRGGQNRPRSPPDKPPGSRQNIIPSRH